MMYIYWRQQVIEEKKERREETKGKKEEARKKDSRERGKTCQQVLFLFSHNCLTCKNVTYK